MSSKKNEPGGRSTPKTDEIRIRVEMGLEKDRQINIKPNFVPGTLEHTHSLHPWQYAQSNPNLFGKLPETDNEILFKRDLEVMKTLTLPRIESPKLKCRIIDAETGSPLQLTNAKWSKYEGNVDPLNTRNMLQIGTGKLTIKEPDLEAEKIKVVDDNKGKKNTGKLSKFKKATNAIKAANLLNKNTNGNISFEKSMTGPDPNSNKTKRHPLVLKFMKEGPLNIAYHKYWNSRDDKVSAPEGEAANIIDSDYESDEEEKRPIDNGPVVLVDMIKDLSLQVSEYSFDDTISINNQAEINLKNQLNPVEPDEFMELYEKAEKHLENETIWAAMEMKFFKELSKNATKLEKNKKLTKEKKFPGGVDAMNEACKKIAQLRTNSIRTLLYSVAEENKRETERKMLEKEVTIDKLKETLVNNENDRHKRRAMIRIMQFDMEVVLIKKMADLGLLW